MNLHSGTAALFSSMLMLAAFMQGAVEAEELFNADLYLAGTNRQQLIFRQKNSIVRKKDITVLTHTYTHVDGRLAAREEVTLREGKFQKYEVNMPETGCGCLLERDEGKLRFSFTRPDNPKKGEDNFTSDLVTGPTLTDFVHSRWAALRRGETVFFNLPSMTLQRLARFQLKQITGSPRNREGVAVFLMKIDNVFFRLLLEPVELVYDVRTRRLVEIYGQSLLERRVNGRLENPVVDIVYRYDR